MTNGQIAQALICKLLAHGVNTVCAGGAARDTVLRREVKDFDLVVIDGSSFADVLVALEDAQGITFVQTYDPKYEDGQRFDYCAKIVVTIDSKPVHVDVIGLKQKPRNAQEVIDLFDFSINQAYFDPDGYVVVSHYFGNKKVKVMPHADLSIERTKKFAQKFPEYDWKDVYFETQRRNPVL